MKNKIKPHQPTSYKKGCSQQREYDELTVYGDKYRFPAITTFCDYVDKNGNLVERYLLRVKWISWEEVKTKVFEELANLKMDSDVDESVAKGFNVRQKVRDEFYEKNSKFEEGWF